MLRTQSPLRIPFALLACATPCALGLAPAHAQSSFTPLGDLPGGTFASIVTGVSADGTTAVGYSEGDAPGYAAANVTANQ